MKSCLTERLCSTDARNFCCDVGLLGTKTCCPPGKRSLGSCKAILSGLWISTRPILHYSQSNVVLYPHLVGFIMWQSEHEACRLHQTAILYRPCSVLDRLQCRLAFTVGCALIAAEQIAMLQPRSMSYVELIAYELQLPHAQAALPIFVRIEYSIGR